MRLAVYLRGRALESMSDQHCGTVLAYQEWGFVFKPLVLLKNLKYYELFNDFNSIADLCT
jgi:hypothetical protein